MRRLSILPSSLLIGLVTFTYVLQAAASARTRYQSTSVLQGRVVDQNGEVVPRARITAQNTSTGVGRFGESDRHGNYQIAALPVGVYRLEIKAPGFRPETVPVPGQCVLTLNFAGNREDLINFMVTGITLTSPFLTSVRFTPPSAPLRKLGSMNYFQRGNN